MGSKRITNPFDGTFSASVKQHAVKAAITFGFFVGHQIMLSGQNDSSLLALRDARRRAAIGGVTAQADFDKNECFPVAANEVDFTTATVEVTRQNAQPALFKKTRGQVLGAFASHFA